MTIPSSPGWNAAVDIIQHLRAGGHRALLAGGCVRDILLSRFPKDYDVATDATPDRVAELFPKARKVGAKFGVMLVRRHGHDIEVATFRSDGTYSDGRHPDQVTFGTEVEDAQRRDFTINGLFYDPIDQQLIDYVDGGKDLNASLIRTIGDPIRRFTEDHLRMLRAVRFSAALGFRIEENTWRAIHELASHLRGISPERVWMELSLMLVVPTRAEAWFLLVTTGLAHHLAPSWTISTATANAVKRRLENLPGSIGEELALAALLIGHAREQVNQIGRDLRLSNRLIEAAVWLLRCLPLARDEAHVDLADLKTMMSNPHWPALLDLLRADLLAEGTPTDAYERLRIRAGAIVPDAVTPPPLLTGDDLLEMGVAQGPLFGQILRNAYREQLNERLTSKQEALSFARNALRTEPRP